MRKEKKSKETNQNVDDLEKEKVDCSCDESESNCANSEDEKNSEVLEDKEFEGINDDSQTSCEKVLDELKTANKNLADENNKLNSEVDALKDRITRLSAEYDNFRKRTAREKEAIYTDACEDVLKKMLPVLDNLERALTVEGNADDIKKGIDMTLRQFMDSLEKLQVEEIDASGKFDPNLHNAVMHVDDENCGENEIVEVFQKGYKRGDKVLRHSMVKVAN